MWRAPIRTRWIFFFFALHFTYNRNTQAHTCSQLACTLELANSQTWSTLLTSGSEWLWQIGVCWWIGACILCVTTLGVMSRFAPKVTSALVTERDVALDSSRRTQALFVCVCTHTRVCSFVRSLNQEEEFALCLNAWLEFNRLSQMSHTFIRSLRHQTICVPINTLSRAKELVQWLLLF